MFRLALVAAAAASAVACQGEECEASSLLQNQKKVQSQDFRKVLQSKKDFRKEGSTKDAPKDFPRGCKNGIVCKTGACRCAEPGEIKKITPDMIKKAERRIPATPKVPAQRPPAAAADGSCVGKSILCQSAKSEENCNFWKRVGCSWGPAAGALAGAPAAPHGASTAAASAGLHKDFPTGCTHGIQCNEDGCRCAEPGEVKQITEDIKEQVATQTAPHVPGSPEAPAQAAGSASSGEACTGSSEICAKFTTEKMCSFFAKSQGCSWSKSALLVDIKEQDHLAKELPKGCKDGIVCHYGKCRCAEPGEVKPPPPKDEACTGSSPLCANLPSPDLCSAFGQKAGCSWGKASLVDIKEVKNSKY